MRATLGLPAPPILLPDGRSLPVSVRPSDRAQRLALRVSATAESVELVIPRRTSLAAALAFLDQRRGWVVARALKLPARVAFADGAEIPYLGRPHRLTAIGPVRGRHPFVIADGRIEVTGAVEHLARRTRDGFKAEARRLLATKTLALAERLDRPVARVTVGDAATRWGSCAASGRIRYSWRLVMAPERVVDYVVAHEVAHLAEMNHSRRFWRRVEFLHAGWQEDRAWLTRFGARLMLYG